MPDGDQRSAAFPNLALALGVEDEAWEGEGLGDLEAFARRAIEAALQSARMPAGLASELSVTLADDGTVRALNAEWRGKDKATNVLSFPLVQLAVGDVPGPLLGDLILAHETVAREARSEGKPFAHHFTHLLVHGLLHLIGHDHLVEAQAEAMEALEIEILRGLGIPDPYGEAAEEAPARNAKRA
ncbi:rRNA maturation RNase YbeY [Aurantimonas sp. Leaf443]|uniref:rRNA maturation RNase YbeY n=1 Tax=Aurantimonas sp. Leaf443 TaxID=1736378 RepID=UPI0006FBD656|nr:rRNA maturation RNase YbeY [Aurantimonas sp. Leaf443]KQT83935.1 hypothetical protein ASG48_11145 [Aurantimonas sp. Leaf443]